MKRKKDIATTNSESLHISDETEVEDRWNLRSLLNTSERLNRFNGEH